MILICPRCGAERQEAILDKQICSACNIALYPISFDCVSAIPNELHVTNSQLNTLIKEKQRVKTINFSHLGETTTGEQVLGYVTESSFEGEFFYFVHSKLIGKRGKLRPVSLYGPMSKKKALVLFNSRKSRT